MCEASAARLTVTKCCVTSSCTPAPQKVPHVHVLCSRQREAERLFEQDELRIKGPFEAGGMQLLKTDSIKKGVSADQLLTPQTNRILQTISSGERVEQRQ